MKMFLRCLTTTDTDGPVASLGLLLFRVALCCGLLIHGIPKVLDFEALSKTFPDPIGTGSFIALCMVILAEVVCAAPVMLGFLTRFAVLPPIIMMLVAVFIFHVNDPFPKKEPALFYLCGYSLLLLLGPGRYSLDGLIHWFLSKPQTTSAPQE